MFTGIVQGLGTVASREPKQGDEQLTIDFGDTDLGLVTVGDSVSVSGVCLTATAFDEGRFVADVSRETLSLTTLGELTVGDRVNLETALRAGDPMGGHIVSGHVDAVGVLEEMNGDARSWRLVFSVPEQLQHYIASKGSIAVNGISLTVNEVAGRRFGVNIIPHTMENTVLGMARIGDRVNIEVDVVARYLARMSGRE